MHGLTCHIRLCIATMLRARAGECVILLGMKCSSWTVVNQGTSRRAPCCPSGDTTKVSVKMANCMAARKLSFINLFFFVVKAIEPKMIPTSCENLEPPCPAAFQGRYCYVYLPWPQTTCTFWSNRSNHCCVGMEGFGTFKVSAVFLDYIFFDLILIS